jgi:hypothetical protein
MWRGRGENCEITGRVLVRSKAAKGESHALAILEVNEDGMIILLLGTRMFESLESAYRAANVWFYGVQNRRKFIGAHVVALPVASPPHIRHGSQFFPCLVLLETTRTACSWLERWLYEGMHTISFLENLMCSMRRCTADASAIVFRPCKYKSSPTSA